MSIRRRIALAWRALTGAPEPEPPSQPAAPPGEALRLLALLQCQGRLVDWLLDTLDGVSDADLAAVSRAVHRATKKALQEHLVIEPVVTVPEGGPILLRGYDPAAIVLHQAEAGDGLVPVNGHGLVSHHGWRVGDFILQPAEVLVP